MKRFDRDVVLVFFILLFFSFLLGAYYVLYTGAAEVWRGIPFYQALFSVSKFLLFVIDLPIYLYLVIIPPFVSANLPTLAVIVVVFFILLDISYLYVLSSIITSYLLRKRSS